MVMQNVKMNYWKISSQFRYPVYKMFLIMAGDTTLIMLKNRLRCNDFSLPVNKHMVYAVDVRTSPALNFIGNFPYLGTISSGIRLFLRTIAIMMIAA